MNRKNLNPGLSPKINHLIFSNKYGNFPTQSRNRTRNLLHNFLKDYNKGTFVEIGAYGGASLFLTIFTRTRFPVTSSPSFI